MENKKQGVRDSGYSEVNVFCISHGSPEKQTNRIEIRDIGDR
jgi:hypothetical protein